MSRRPTLSWYLNLIISIIFIVLVLSDSMSYMIYGTIHNLLIVRVMESFFMIFGVLKIAYWLCVNPYSDDETPPEDD